MIRSYRAELVKLGRRRVVFATALVTLLFAVGGAAVVLAAAGPAAEAGPGRAPTIEALSTAVEALRRSASLRPSPARSSSSCSSA